MKRSLLVFLLAGTGVLQGAVAGRAEASTNPNSTISNEMDGGAEGAQPSNVVNVPGPLRSFLRMAGLSQDISTPEVLPILSHTVVLQGYMMGRPTEFLVLLRRYVNQANELTTLAGAQSELRVSGCKDSDSLLRVLGYKIDGQCGQSSMALITADSERAFLTCDSGFPLLELEEALQHDKAFEYSYKGAAVPVLFRAEDWVSAANQKGQERKDFLENMLYRTDFARLYWAMSQIEPQARQVLKKDVGLARLLPLAPVLDLYGSQICVRDGAVVLPGGKEAEKQWQEMVGVSPKSPGEFAVQLLTKEHGWLGAYFDAMARTSQEQQAHFAQNQRMKRFYAAFRAPGANSEAGARLPFRPAPALMVLVTRMQWDANGEPYVPGGLPAWSEILRDSADSKFIRQTGKHSGAWHNPDQLAEAMFAFSRLETDTGPLQAYLCLSELDRRRGSVRRLGSSTVVLLAQKFHEYGDQYLVFSEFPELTDESITRFLTTAEALNKISDHTVRGNAMGIFQANVGLWQILARQGEIEHAQLNSTWREVIKPFSGVTSAAELVTVGRSSVDQLFRATTGRGSGSQEELLNLLAGGRQVSPEGQQMHTELTNRLRLVMEDQRLVSMDTLFALDDALRNPELLAKKKEQYAALAGELREFEMPQPIFSNSERDRWAAGTYNNRHTELQMKTDLAKVIRGSASPKQLETARGQLATFLRDTLVGVNYAYYEPPDSQVLHNNPLFVRSHDFSGDTVMGVEHLWQAPQLFGAGSPAGGGAHLIGSLADLPYVLAEVEQDFIAPDHVQALIWQQFVPGLLSNAVVPRWWDVSRDELHAVALYQRAGEELLQESGKDQELRKKVMAILSDRMFPERRAWVEQAMGKGDADLLQGLAPADTFYLAEEFRRKFPDEFSRVSTSGAELEQLMRKDPDAVNWDRLSRDFGVIHPVFTQTYGREFINVRPFPALGGNYNRLMGECWDSGNLYWARLADEKGYAPVLLNKMVPELTHRMVERISASDLEDWPATLRALRETGEEFRSGKISFGAAATVASRNCDSTGCVGTR